MCCLFGLIDYGHSLTRRQKNRILSALATSSEARGTDATGIAYNAGGELRIYKRPCPGHLVRFRTPGEAHVVMGHTRLATQGDAQRNRNNHPFLGTTKNGTFALAHNGVIYNDEHLRRLKMLPGTKVETDSFIGVQLIEQKKTLDFSSLKYMAEQVRGSFSFTVLDQHNVLYVVKGDSPFSLYEFPTLGAYLYASTKDILEKAIALLPFPLGKHRVISVQCGEILQINREGMITRKHFDDSNLFSWGHSCLCPSRSCRRFKLPSPSATDHLDEIKLIAPSFGYSPEEIERLSRQGFTPEELEEFLYSG